jgi:hypothetical protein
MKKIFVKLLFIAIVPLIYNCNSHDYIMYTRINPDGSCYREFVVNTDSSFFAGDTSRNPFPMKIDSTWILTFHKKNANVSSWFRKYPASNNYKQGDSTFSYFALARKEYPSIRNLAETFRFNDSNWDSIVPIIFCNEKFRWFYTYYEFSETYPHVNPFKLIPINDYLSDNEIETWFGENKDLFIGKNGIETSEMLKNLEEKVDAWLEKSYYEEVFRQFLKCYNQFKGMPVDSATFALAKDSIFKFIKDSLDNNSNSISIFDNDFVKAFDLYFQTDAFSRNITGDVLEKLENEIPDFTGFFNIELNYQLSLPGKIIETNAPFINGDTLTWKVDANRFFLTDYNLNALSRKPNYWAFGVTGIIIALSVLGFWVKRKQ